MCMNPPRVYEVAIPSSHIIIKIMKMVQSMGFSFERRHYRFDRLVSLGVQRLHPLLDRGLVEARFDMMMGDLDTQGFTQRRQQMFLVHLREALHGLVVLDALGNVPQLRNRLLFQLFVGDCGGHTGEVYSTETLAGAASYR